MENRIDALNKTIEEQSVKISNYKIKLRDVVQAYKDLAQEKQALEATISALKNIRPQAYIGSEENKTSDVSSINEPTIDSKKDNFNEDEISLNDNAKESAKTCDDDHDEAAEQSKNMKKQIEVLTTSLLTVTQQKNKLESSCIAERKQFKQDLDDRTKELENLREKLTQQESENADWRNKLRHQQLDHDKQQNDCVLMMKELQSLLNSEKILNEQLRSQAEDMRVEMDEKKKAVSMHLNLIASKETSLKHELEATKESLREALLKLNEPSPKIAILEQQIFEAKEKENALKKNESKKLEEAEQKISEISELTESRICSLEEKILDLSEMLGNTEKSKLSDQVTIQKLKERSSQLEQENRMLLALKQSQSNYDLEDLDANEIVVKLKTTITDLISKGHDLSTLRDVITVQEDIHKFCKLQLGQVQEEFERYKLRAQSVLKNKNKDTSSETEVIQLKRQVSEQKDKIRSLKNEIQTKYSELKIKDESLSKMLSSLSEKHKSELNHANIEWQQKISNLEAEMRKQRERTVNMLADKEQEISELKFHISSMDGKSSTVNEKLPSKIDFIFDKQTMFQQLPDDNDVGASSGMLEGNDEADRESNNAIKQLLSRRPEAALLSQETGNLLHFAHERARLEMEVASLRKQKHAVESTVRELQYLLVSNDDEHKLQTDALKESIRKMERDIGRESANMEYLKNVVFHYLICKENSSRQQMFNAISTILEFSPAEKQIVQNKKGWRS